MVLGYIGSLQAFLQVLYFQKDVISTAEARSIQAACVGKAQKHSHLLWEGCFNNLFCFPHHLGLLRGEVI